MLTTKMIKNTFGAKIGPYGFRYKGFKHRRWTFGIELDNRTQDIVVQKDPGSFQLILEFPCGRHKTWELFGDLEYHPIVRKTDEELEDLLNTLGDHFVKRVIPKLPEVMIPDKNDLYLATKEMHLKLYQEREKLISQFLTRHQISDINEADMVMKKLLRDAEWVKDKPFEKIENILVEMAAVYGAVIIQNIGGEWGELEYGYIEIKKLPSMIPRQSPLGIMCRICPKGGGEALASAYAEIQSKYRYWVAEQYREYGKNWKPLKPIVKTNKNLLTEEAVRETIGEKTKDMGFVYKKLVSYFLELEDNDCDMTIEITEDEWQRNGFYVALSKVREGYLYSDYFFYEDETEMRMQLNHVGDEIKEIIRQDRISPRPLLHTILKHGYYITPEVDDQFLLQRENMAEQFREQNGISKVSEENEILQCIAGHLDALVGNEFEDCREELLEMGAVYGDLIIRQIGGVWYEYEQWRMKQIHSGIYDVPAIDRILPHYDIVECWENGGSRQLIWIYQEYKWRYEEWKRLCDLAGI